MPSRIIPGLNSGTYIHPIIIWFTQALVSSCCAGSVSCICWRHPRCPEALRSNQALLYWKRNLLTLMRALPLNLRYYNLMRQSQTLLPFSVLPCMVSLCWLLPSQLEVGPSRRYLWKSFSGCQNPYPGCSCSAFCRFFLQDYGFPQQGNGSALSITLFNSF